MENSPYNIIKHRIITEKSSVLAGLKDAESNRYVRKCKSPKVVFLVDNNANKKEIAWALEKIYAKKKIKVVSVNTINVKQKKRRVRGRVGMRKGYKKAVITLEEGDTIDEQV